MNIHKRPVFPIMYSGNQRTSVPFLLAGTQWIDMQHDYYRAIKMLAAAISAVSAKEVTTDFSSSTISTISELKDQQVSTELTPLALPTEVFQLPEKVTASTRIYKPVERLSAADLTYLLDEIVRVETELIHIDNERYLYDKHLESFPPYFVQRKHVLDNQQENLKRQLEDVVHVYPIDILFPILMRSFAYAWNDIVSRRLYAYFRPVLEQLHRRALEAQDNISLKSFFELSLGLGADSWMRDNSEKDLDYYLTQSAKPTAQKMREADSIVSLYRVYDYSCGIHESEVSEYFEVAQMIPDPNERPFAVSSVLICAACRYIGFKKPNMAQEYLQRELEELNRIKPLLEPKRYFMREMYVKILSISFYLQFEVDYDQVRRLALEVKAQFAQQPEDYREYVKGFIYYALYKTHVGYDALRYRILARDQFMKPQNQLRKRLCFFDYKTIIRDLNSDILE